MSNEVPQASDRSQLRQKSISRWDNEGGAGPGSPADRTRPGAAEQWDVPELSNADLVQLRIRVIALENLLIALLSEASDRQFDLIREMAITISPRAGHTQHPLTIHAATQMNHLVDRATHFKS